MTLPSELCGPHITEQAMFICWRPKRHGGPHVLCQTTPDEEHVAFYLIDWDGTVVTPNILLDQEPVSVAVDNFIEFCDL